MKGLIIGLGVFFLLLFPMGILQHFLYNLFFTFMLIVFVFLFKWRTFPLFRKVSLTIVGSYLLARLFLYIKAIDYVTNHLIEATNGVETGRNVSVAIKDIPYYVSISLNSGVNSGMTSFSTVNLGTHLDYMVFAVPLLMCIILLATIVGVFDTQIFKLLLKDKYAMFITFGTAIVCAGTLVYSINHLAEIHWLAVDKLKDFGLQYSFVTYLISYIFINPIVAFIVIAGFTMQMQVFLTSLEPPTQLDKIEYNTRRLADHLDNISNY